MNFLAQIADSLNWIFGGDVPVEPLQLHQVAARTLVIYVIGVALVRIGKSRLLSRLSAADVLVGFVLGSLLSRGITGNASISGTAAASAALIAIHWLFTRVACSSHQFGNFLKGRSDQIVKDGQLLCAAMRRHHISTHDLDEQLRLRGIPSLNNVEAAYKERSGEVSVIPRRRPPHILEVAVEAGIKTVRIKLE